MDTQTRYLSVPGARLCYDIQGSGPLLAMIGSPMGSRGFAEIAGLLARTYTVLRYDSRGILRSSVDDPAQDAGPELLADDVSQLITAMEAGPAFLFGNSGGAVTGLALLARHPELVRVLVAHEPPLVELLPDRDELGAAISEAGDTYTGTGRDAGLRQYTALTGIQFGRRSMAPDTETFTPPDNVRAILDRFFLNILRPTTRYRPDTAALRESASRIVVGAGTDSQGQLYHRCAVALARHLDIPVVGFPGGHTGFQEEPKQFADLLNRVFSGALETSPSRYDPTRSLRFSQQG